jgi:hypothetical protein
MSCEGLVGVQSFFFPTSEEIKDVDVGKWVRRQLIDNAINLTFRFGDSLPSELRKPLSCARWGQLICSQLRFFYSGLLAKNLGSVN